MAWGLGLLFCCLPCLRFWGLHQAFTYKQLYTETQFHLDGLIAGSLVALWVVYYRLCPQTLRRLAYLGLSLGLVASIFGFRQGGEVLRGSNVVFGFTTLAVGFAGLLLYLLQSGASLPVRIFSWKPVCFVGRISYGIYLLHDGVIALLRGLPFHVFTNGSTAPWWLAIPLRMALSIGAAALSYRFFESPILRLKERLR